jgi:hypothetical protein
MTAFDLTSIQKKFSLTDASAITLPIELFDF